MIIAVASGKGGTGKTTLATNLAVAISRSGLGASYVDCDVEEPNGHIFLKPTIEEATRVGIPVPDVDKDKCDGCGKCDEICQYSAIVCINKNVLTFPELCHGCGGCSRLCPQTAIVEVTKEIGVVERGMSNGVGFLQGRLKIGEVMAPPLIREVKKRISNGAITIVDAPPGTSCPVIEAIKGSDYVLLVTEPTPFGLNDLELAVGMTRELSLPFGVIINRCDVGDDRVKKYCEEEQIELLLEIPDNRRIAEAYSKGELVLEVAPEYEGKFMRLYERIAKEAKG